VTQVAMSLFMDEGHFSAHLRRMRGVYRAKRSALLDVLAPMASLGWTWPSNPAGMHLLLSHRDGRYVRAVAQRSELDLALLSAYRQGPRDGDGLLLRFGALDSQTIAEGAATLLRAASLR